MTTFEEAIASAVDDAVKASGECTRRWFDTMAHLVDGAVAQTTTADSITQDLTLLATAGVRDAARAMSIWITVGQAIADLPLSGSDPSEPA